jgi:glyoxylase I family protein
VATQPDLTLFSGSPDVDAASAHLHAEGIDVKPPAIAPYGMKQLFFHDPDGSDLCFQWKLNGLL